MRRLSAAMQSLAQELEPQGIGVLLLHPGAVPTRMRPRRGISCEESVRGLRNVIAGFERRDLGRFLRYDGTEMPW